jgi:dihydrofolate reductase
MRAPSIERESEMRRVIASEWMTLDGVVQSPSSPDEDPSGGFGHGGWHVPFVDEMFMRWVVESVEGAGGYLLGRRTWEIFAAHWPNASPEEQVLAQPLNTRPKYVASTTLAQPLAWQNSTLLRGDVARAVAALKRDDGGDLLVIGSPELLQTLLAHGLVDELRLIIDPLVVGGGKRLFRDDGALRSLRLVDSHTTSTGAIILTYAPAAG